MMRVRYKYRFFIKRIRRKVATKRLLYGIAAFSLVMWITGSVEEESSLVQKSLNVFTGYGGTPGITMDTSQCYSSSRDIDITADVFTSEILDYLLVKYPATGGLYPRGFLRPDITEFEHRTNETPGFNELPLEVVVVPHVHLEAGWLKTYQDYSTEYVDRILKSTMEKLNMFPDLSLVWVETCFLNRWWKDQPDTVKEMFLSLVQGGRIEMVSGMWVSPDEATPHYFSLIDQMIEGHYWVKNTLGVVPETTVSFDQAGYSASVPYLNKKAGIKQMVMKRVNHAVKDLMGTKRWMTYEWRQLWDTLGNDDIIGHIEPYENLGIQDSCGPIRGICKELDFIRMVDFPLPGSAAANNEIGINKFKNFRELIASVIGELKKKAMNYEEKVILLPYGGEFYFHEKWHWEKIYRNMKILMNYVNQRSSVFNVNIHFGTMKDYFDSLHRQRERFNMTLPVISGDFFSYTKMSEYWSGYFTTRMFGKRLSREVQESVRAAELMSAIVFQGADEIPSDRKNSIMTQLVDARQNLGLYMHHQAISGTTHANVAVDYEKRLTSAFKDAQSALASAISYLVQTKEAETRGFTFEPYLTRSAHNELTEERPIPVTSKGTRVVLVNSLTQSRTEIVTLAVASAAVLIVDPKGHAVKFDIEDAGQGSTRITFEAILPAVSTMIYTVKSDSSSRNRARQNVERIDANKDDVFVCENVYMNATFSRVNGTLLRMCYRDIGKCLGVEVDWVAYQSNTGAYIMNSNVTTAAMKSSPTVTAVKGKRHCRVKAVYDILKVEYVLPNTKGIQGRSIKIEVISDLPKKYDADLAMRFKTTIRNLDFYTDSNGFQIIRRKFRQHLPFGASIFPMTSMAFIESINTRMVVHSAQPHGVISPERSFLDVFVDRVAPAIENGLLESVTDNKPTKTLFLLEVESLVPYSKPRIVEGMLPSINTVFLGDTLQHPIYAFYTTYENAKVLPTERSFMREPLPCDVILANARTLADDENKAQGTSLTFFRRGISCMGRPGKSYCPLYHPTSINPGYLFGKEDSRPLKATEMLMSQLQERPDQPSNISSIHMQPMDIRTFLLVK